MEPANGLRRLFAIFLSFAVTIAIQLFVGMTFLIEPLRLMQDQGVLRGDSEGLSGIILFLVVFVLAVWVMSEFCQRASSRLDSFYFGLLTGVLVSLPFIIIHNLYVVQWQIPVIMIATNLISFSIAGIVYGLTVWKR